MSRDLNKEAHLWYTITSPDYLQKAQEILRDAAAFLRTRAESHEFIMQYPPVPHWLGVMEYLIENFPNAKAMLMHGEYSTIIDWVRRMQDIPRSLSESEMGWLPREEEDELMSLLNSAYRVCSRFDSALTMSRYFSDDEIISGKADWKEWYPEDHGYTGDSIVLLSELYPLDGPEYMVDSSITCSTGQIVPWTGVWVPIDGMGTSALAFARQGQIMQPAYEIVSKDEETGYEEMRPVETTWYPVRPTGRLLSAIVQDTPRRVPAGQSCPLTGWWYTPAKASSHRYFKQGEVFPKIEGSDYGETFRLWSQDQTSPSS
ncbi:MAG: hypothetical protein QM581_03400 [Pseudomonas sp.]